MDTKLFISNFDFRDPDFGGVPDGFPLVSKAGLTREEEHLLEAITTAWIMQQPSIPNSLYAYVRSSNFINASFKASVNVFILSIIFLGFITTAYYLNIEYHLGLTFLTEFFA